MEGLYAKLDVKITLKLNGKPGTIHETWLELKPGSFFSEKFQEKTWKKLNLGEESNQKHNHNVLELGKN